MEKIRILHIVRIMAEKVMLEFTLSDLNRRPGEVVEAALTAPVCLTRHGRKKLVILHMDRYDELVGMSVSGNSAEPKSTKGRGLAQLNAVVPQYDDWPVE